MNFEQVYQIKDESEQLQKTYELFDEDTRLNRSKAARVEFFTTTRYIEKYLKPGARILDVGAGAGEYSLYFAEKGYAVRAVELAQSNLNAFRKKIKPGQPIELFPGNAIDLSMCADNAYDVVLLLGPLYHLRSEADRKRCIAEAKRVCKDDGVIFFAFISNDMVILTELGYDDKFFLGSSYDHETFQLEDFPFVFFTPDRCRAMLEAEGVKVLHAVGSDGVSELLEEKINALDEESYGQYLRFHFYRCEKPDLLGASNHLLFVGRLLST